MNTSNQQPTKLEELAANAEMAVCLFSQAIGEDYSEVEARIVRDFRRYEDNRSVTAEDVLADMRAYAEASGREVHQLVALNKDNGYRSPEMVEGGKAADTFFESVDEMLAPRHVNKESF